MHRAYLIGEYEKPGRCKVFILSVCVVYVASKVGTKTRPASDGNIVKHFDATPKVQ